MNCGKCSESLLDYIEGELSEHDAEGVKKHLLACPRCSAEHVELSMTWESLAKLPKPSPALKQRFSAALGEYKKGKLEGLSLARDEVAHSGNLIVRMWRIGYVQAACIAVAFIVGALTTTNGPSDKEERLASIESDLASLREFTALSLLNQTSPAERLRGLDWIARAGIENPQTLKALYNTLNYDPNINVRFAALETLETYAGNAEVRRELVDLLETPNSPMIRAEIIKLLVRRAERSSLPELQRISQNEDENVTVRELAKWSVEQLETVKYDEA